MLGNGIMQTTTPRRMENSHPDRLWRRWRRSGKALLREVATLGIRCRTSSDALAIHDWRAALRRLNLLLRIGRTSMEHPRLVAKVRLWISQMTTRTSRLRDYDSALGWLRMHQAPDSVCQELEKRRQALWRRNRKTWTQMPARWSRRLLKFKKQSVAAARLALRHRKTTSRQQTTVTQCCGNGPTLASAAQHDLRRAVRRWRYLVELELPPRQQAENAALTTLVTTQRVLGQDRTLELTDHLMKQAKPSPEWQRWRKRIATERRSQQRQIRLAIIRVARLSLPRQK